MELYASPAATKQLLDDAIVDVESWITSEIDTAFGEQESAAFITGDGATKPKGILAYPRQPADTDAFGQVGTVATGVDGDSLWQARLGETLETNLLGFPVAECEDMPDMAPGAAAIAFGDFGRGYLLVDLQGVQVLRDPYSAKPYVLFYATKRVRGGMLDHNALRLLSFEA